MNSRGTTVILIRHAASSGQAPGAELTPQGRDQAVTLATRLGDLQPDRLYSSPYRRAHATIEPFAVARGLEISTLDGLRERLLAPAPQSDWLNHIERSFDDTDYCLSGGESMNQTSDRAFRALAKITQGRAKRPVAVSHGNLIASVLHRIDPAFGFRDWRDMAKPDLFEVTLVDGHAKSFRPI